jgi:hypothetical protein
MDCVVIIRAAGLLSGRSSATSQDLGIGSIPGGACALAGVKECGLQAHTFQIFVCHRGHEEIRDFDGDLTKSFRAVPLRPWGR